MPKVSIVVPCYNVEPYIERCLNSLCQQTLSDIEIICIDDKSTDKTLKIIKEFAHHDKRIHVIAMKNNEGVAVARNAGMAVATGDYIGFVDPDDYVDTDFYEKLYYKALETGADIVKGGVLLTDTNTGMTKKDNMNEKIRRNIVYFSSAFWSAIYKRSFLIRENIQFPKGVITSQDSVFLTHTTLVAQKVKIVKDTFYHYFYQRPGSLDSFVLSHAKAASKYTAFSMNLKLIESKKLYFEDFEKFVDCHVLSHIAYELSKNFEQEEDKKHFFDLAVEIYTKYKLSRYMKARFGKEAIKYFKKRDFDGYKQFVATHHKRIYMFGFLPIIRVNMYETHKEFRLFDILPLLKVSYGRKFYLFNILLILKIR